MKFITSIFQKNPKDDLLEYLIKLRSLESQIFGITLNDTCHEEEILLEDANHLIYLINSRKKQELKTILTTKDTKDFLIDLQKIQNSFHDLKNMIRKEDRLRKLIAAYSIRLLKNNKFDKLRNLLELESQLNDILDIQDQELSSLITSITKIKFSEKKKLDLFVKTLKDLREILGGHMEHHKLWEEERMGYSNASNIINSLIKEVKEEIQ